MPRTINKDSRTILDEDLSEWGIPKFWDNASGRVLSGVRRRTTESVLNDIEAYTGIWPVACCSALRQSARLEVPPLPVENAATPAEIERIQKVEQAAARSVDPHFVRAYSELQAFLDDPEASVSLWLIRGDHMCVGEPLPAGNQDRGGSTKPGSRATEQRSTARKGKSKAQTKAEDKIEAAPMVLNVNYLVNQAELLQNQNVPLGTAFHPALSTSKDDRKGSGCEQRVIRIALDFQGPFGRGPIQRTGTLLLGRDSTRSEVSLEEASKSVNTKKGRRAGAQTSEHTLEPIGWYVRWDDPSWCEPSRVGVNFTLETTRQKTDSAQSGIQAQRKSGEDVTMADSVNSSEEAPTPFLCLAWACPIPRRWNINEGEPARVLISEWRLLSVLCKKQPGWAALSDLARNKTNDGDQVIGGFDRDERDRLGLACTEKYMEKSHVKKREARDTFRPWIQPPIRFPPA